VHPELLVQDASVDMDEEELLEMSADELVLTANLLAAEAPLFHRPRGWQLGRSAAG